MEIDDHFEFVRLGPSKSLFKVRELALNVWVACIVQRPIADWETNVIETAEGERCENAPSLPERHVTYPAAAISLKSCSVIHVFQCCSRAALATSRGWY